MAHDPQPVRISIITATYNSAATIGDCLASVTGQDVAVEHIVVDGASTDGTLEVVRAVGGDSLQVVSEPDRGVYDAMNKGIARARGDVVGILNSDDYYAAPDVLSSVRGAFADPTIGACYGDIVYVASGDTGRTVRYWKAGAFDRRRFLWGWMPPHPTFFVRRSVYEKHGSFNLDLGSAADYEIMLRMLLKNAVPTAYIPRVLVKMRTGGVSNASIRNRLAANRMDRRAWKVNGLRPYPWTLWVKPLRKLGQWVAREPAAAPGESS
jgi:glycosyltransferase involved in cell wall biosynthesis